MRRMLTISFVGVVLLSAALKAGAQVDPRPYHPVADSVENAVKDEFPDYKRTSIPPAQPPGSLVEFTDDVIIDQWRSDKASVRVSILIYPSKDEAKRALKRFIANVKVNSYVDGVGTESYVWGIEQSVAFRKGRYAIFVDAAPVRDNELTVLPPPEDRAKYTKAFARVVAKALRD